MGRALRLALLSLIAVTSLGCSGSQEAKAPAPREAPDERFVFFGSGRVDVRPEGYFDIGYVAALLEEEPAFHVLIVGHADQVGPSELNKQIAFRRALAVRKILIDKGISEGRILVAAPKEGDQGTMAQMSRRADLFVYDPIREEVSKRLGYPVEVRQK